MKPKYIERKCKHHGITTYYYNGRGYSCKKCNAASMMRCRQKVMDKLLNLVGPSCKLCGYNKCKRALHFHHIDPKTKSFTISSYAQVTKLELLIEESKKCILLCANCHAEVEAGVTECAIQLVTEPV